MATGFDAECEKSIIAAMLQKESHLSKIITEVNPEDITQDGLRQLFFMISDMYNANKEVNARSVAVEYKDEIKKLNFGCSYSMLATQLVMSGVDAMIRRVKEEKRIRDLLTLSDQIKAMTADDADSTLIYKAVETALMAATATGIERTYISPQKMSETCLDAICERMDKDKRREKVLYTSFKKLNGITGGFEKGDLIILSGETGTGKSAFAMNIAKDTGIAQKRPTLYLNSEMGADQMALRWSSHLASVSHTRLRNGEIGDMEFQQVTGKLDKLFNSQMHTLTIPDLQISNVIAETRRAKKQHNIEIVIVDYIGRMDTTNSKNKEDWQVLKAAAQKLKTMAQEMGLVVIMIAQLNNDGKLAQSSYMSHEADLWINLKQVSEDDQQKLAPWNVILEIKKARNAASSKGLSMRFNGDVLTYTDDKEVAQGWYAQDQGTQAARFGAVISMPDKKNAPKSYKNG